MSVEEQVVRLFIAANPVPDPDLLEPLEPLDHLDKASGSSDGVAYIQLERSTTGVPDTGDVVSEPYRDRRQRPSRVRLVAGLVAAAGLVSVLVLVGRSNHDSESGLAPSAENGLIAFVGESDDNPETTDIYLVAPGGTGRRPLTSTPELVEYAPVWSPDGSRLAFVRTSDEEFSPSSRRSWPCSTNCQLVVVDPSTGVETSSADIKEGGLVPESLAWSPDGRAIAISSNFRDGLGNVGPGSSMIVDLESGSVTTFSPPSLATWSPDGEWLSLSDGGAEPGAPLLIVPAHRIPTGGVVDVAGLGGVRSLPESDGLDGSVWMPDGSAMLGTFGNWSQSDQRWIDVAIDIVIVADGERRTLIEDGFDPVVSPDGTQIAYSRGETPSGVREVWVAAADGSDQRRVTTSSTPPAWSPDGSLLLASDQQGWFTVRPDGTDRTALGVRDQGPLFPSLRTVSSGVDWQPARTDQPDPAPQPITTQPPPATETPGDRWSMSGFNRVWPEGATPRGPVTGELVVSMWASQRGWHFVYADGRLIRTDSSSEFQEQHLSPKGVDLVRAEILASGLFDPDRPPPGSELGPAAEFAGSVATYGDIRARIGDRLVYVPRRPGAEWTSKFDRLSARLTDLESWLPPSAWADREQVAYVSSHYAVCMSGDEPSSIDTLLPAPAADLLVGARRWTPEPWEHVDVPDGESQRCFDLTTESARGLAEVLNIDIQRWRTSGLVRFGSHWMHVLFLPYMPHGAVECACYGIG